MARRRTPNRAANATRRRAAELAEIKNRAKTARRTNREKAKRILADIRRRLARIQEDFHAVGRLLIELSAAPLYTALGHQTFEALLEAEDLMPPSTAYRLMRVAKAFDARSAKKLGLSKANALHAYTMATPAADLAKTLAAADAIIGNSKKPVSKISVRELKAETRRVRKRTHKAPPTPEEKTARATARKIQSTLRKRGATDATAEARRIDDRWRITIDLDPAHAETITKL